MEIKIETSGLRLDKALSDLTELSRSLANEQIKSGQVLVNGQVKKAKYTVQEGDVVTYNVPEPEVLEYVAENLPLEISTKMRMWQSLTNLRGWLCIRVLVILVELW